jgi:hypothetical protein
MKYHVVLEYSKEHFWWNYNKEKIIANLLVPFINGQVVLITEKPGKKLLNLKSASKITIYETEGSLVAKNGISITDQIKADEFQKNECTERLIKEAKLDLASSQSLSLLQKSFLPEKDQVFAIMMFNNNKIDSAYEGVVKPVFEQFGLPIIRVDEILNSGKISEQILELISTSKFIYSDLTGARPNCYYETGFAHAMGKEIILTCHKSETIHFDLSGHRFIVWETESELRKELTKRVQALVS